jgi:hypothetical protein
MLVNEAHEAGKAEHMAKEWKPAIDQSENNKVFLLALGVKSLRDDLDSLEARIERLDAFLKTLLLDEAA